MTVAWFAQPFSGGPISLSRFRKPIQSPDEFCRATLISSAPSRETMRRSPFISSVRTSRSRSPRCSSPREKLFILCKCNRQDARRGELEACAPLREQTAGVFGFHHPLDADRHRGGAMRNLVRLRAPDDLGKGMLENTEKFVEHSFTQ